MASVCKILILVIGISACVKAAIFTDSKRSQKLRKLEINKARELVSRSRRDTASAQSQVLTNEVVLNSTEDHTQAYVHWAGKLKSEVMLN